MDVLKTCCREPAATHICACRITHPDAIRDCGKCPKTAPWGHCAHWAIQCPEARLLLSDNLRAADIEAQPLDPIRAAVQDAEEQFGVSYDKWFADLEDTSAATFKRYYGTRYRT